MTQHDVKEWVAFMREHGLKRLCVNGLEVELGAPSSSYSAQNVPPMEPQGAFEDGTGSFCSCGHSWVTDHSDSGCLHGCSHDLCSSSAGAPNV